jgi:methylthioribose-1-phosphate isomerase
VTADEIDESCRGFEPRTGRKRTNPTIRSLPGACRAVKVQSSPALFVSAALGTALVEPLSTKRHNYGLLRSENQVKKKKEDKKIRKEK